MISKNVCNWKWNEETEDDYYDTSCGHSFTFMVGILEDNNDFKYCPYCGGKIVEQFEEKTK